MATLRTIRRCIKLNSEIIVMNFSEFDGLFGELCVIFPEILPLLSSVKLRRVWNVPTFNFSGSWDFCLCGSKFTVKIQFSYVESIDLHRAIDRRLSCVSHTRVDELAALLWTLLSLRSSFCIISLPHTRFDNEKKTIPELFILSFLHISRARLSFSSFTSTSSYDD